MQDLDSFLAQKSPQVEHEEAWSDQRFHVSSYLSQELPAIAFISSVRVIVLDGTDVLVIRDDNDKEHVVPGGRREAGETLEQTARREVLEETGWELGALYVLGFWHYRRLTEVPPDYPHAIHFAQAIYTAQALEHYPEAKLADDYVASSRFLSRDATGPLTLSAGERMFLDAAQRLFEDI